MRVFQPNLREMIEDLLHRQLCAWELLTEAADGAPGTPSDLLRTQARAKREHVRELYDLLRRSASRRAASHVPVEPCDPVSVHEDLPGLLAAIEAHETGTIRAYQAALSAASPREGDVLARQSARTRQSLSAIQGLRSVRDLKGRGVLASPCAVTTEYCPDDSTQRYPYRS